MSDFRSPSDRFANDRILGLADTDDEFGPHETKELIALEVDDPEEASAEEAAVHIMVADTSDDPEGPDPQ